ncbi:CAAX amino protease [Streptococcus sanguinis]|uniref:CAAX amino protease n=1 Tax=Streptococcus sanguinis TaxID=1305 RepID=A0AAJ5NQ67_STRSA|nr:CAAX amino protease [Streptococcus sanguinis]
MKTQTHVEPETRHILPFLAWTFGISWSAWLILYILATLKLTSVAEPLGYALSFIGGFGPTLGTFISLKISRPKKMLDFIFSHAKGWWIYMLAFCLVRILTLFIANPVLPPLNAMLMFPLGWIFVTFVGGGNEELGWRGVLQPALEKKFSFPLATVITALVWVAWHLPLWLIPGTSQSQVSLTFYLSFGILLCFCLAVLYKQTASVFACSAVSGWQLFTRSVSLSSIVSSFMGSLILLAKPSL